MDKLPIYRISGIGSCARALSAERLNYPTAPSPDWLSRAAEEGNRHEIWIKEDLRKEGWGIEEGGLCQKCKEEFDDERFGIHVEIGLEVARLIGHMDGRVTSAARDIGIAPPFPLEVKSRSQYEFDRWAKGGFREFPSNEAQIACYMEAEHSKYAYYVVKNRSNGYLEKKIIESPILFSSIKEKIELVESYVTKNELVPVDYDPNSIHCKRCGYSSYCLTFAEVENIPEPVLLEACNNYRSGKKLEKEAKGLLDSAKKIFDAQTASSGLDKWQFDDMYFSKRSIEEKPMSYVRKAYSFIDVKDRREED